MSRPFLYGFRGKAAWRVSRLIVCVSLIIFLFLKTNELHLSVVIANKVPLVWKWVSLIALQASVAYSLCLHWRHYWRHNENTNLPRGNRGWLLLPVVPAFVFAIITADQRTLFNVGGIMWVLIGYAVNRYYGRKGVSPEWRLDKA
jgi:hypothetical protein